MASAGETSIASPWARAPIRVLDRIGRWRLALLLGLMAVGALLRIIHLGDQSLWLDEVASAYFARVPLHLLWSDWMVRETNPPVYYTLLHYWTAAFGDGEAALRGLSALFGVLSIPLAYAIGRKVHSPRAGLIAAALTCVWTPQIGFAQEARAYTLGLVTAELAVLGLCGIMAIARGDRSHAIWPWLAYGAGTLGALYSHTTLILLPLLANLFFAAFWLTATPRSRSLLLRWIAINALCAAGWLWWLRLTLLQLASPESNINWIGVPDLAALVDIVRIAYLPRDAGVLSVALGVAILVLAGYGLIRMKAYWATLLIALCLGTPMLLFAISQNTPVLLSRTVFWAHFPLLIAAGAGLAALSPPVARAAALALLIALGATDALAMQQARRNEPWREIMTTLGRTLTPHDVVAFSSPSVGVVIDYYCRRVLCDFQVVQLMGGLNDAQRASNRWAADGFEGRKLARGSAVAALNRYDRIVELRRGDGNPDPVVRGNFVFAGTIDIGTELPPHMAIAVWRPVDRAAPL